MREVESEHLKEASDEQSEPRYRRNVSRSMTRKTKRSWSVLVTRVALAVFVGIIAFFNPVVALAISVAFFAIYNVVDANVLNRHRAELQNDVAAGKRDDRHLTKHTVDSPPKSDSDGDDSSRVTEPVQSGSPRTQ